MGKPVRLEPQMIAAQVLETHTWTTQHDLGELGPIADHGRALGFRSAAGWPIMVDGRLWGLIVVGSKRECAFRGEAMSQIGEFTNLVATAIGNAVGGRASSRPGGHPGPPRATGA